MKIDIKVLNRYSDEKGERINVEPLVNRFMPGDIHPTLGKLEDFHDMMSAYDEWLETALREGNEAVVNEMDRLAMIALEKGSLTLKCFCSNDLCHGHRIRAWLIEAIQAHVKG